MNATLMPAEPAPPPTRACPSRRVPWRKLALGVGLGGSLLFFLEAYHVLVGDNLHTLTPGRVYRGAQPSAKDVESLVARHGIRTVVNLRGPCPTLDWYWEEARACQRLGLAMEDVTFSAGRLPSATELVRLVEILDRAEYPIFIHCRRGADRTGMVSAIILLLQTDAGVAQARPAMGLRYGHLNWGRTSYLDQFLDLYEHWLTSQERKHDKDAFRHWLTKEYRGGWLQCRFEEVRPLQEEIRAGRSFAYEVAVRNLADRPWRIKRHTTAGIHLYYRLFDPDGKEHWQTRCTLFEQIVEPGEVLRATVAVPAVQRPGRYRLYLDMVEEDHCTFLQAGAEPRELELDVRE